MLQQTRVAAVIPYFERFLQTLPDIPSLAAAEEDVLLKLWQGLGYYNRAKNLQKTAKLLVEKYNGALPEDFDELLKLPGIGRYTAGAISSIAYGHPHPAVDGNVIRVISRLTLFSEDPGKDRSKRRIEDALRAVCPRNAAGSMNQSLMELGATICLPNGNPLCHDCPLNQLCLAAAHGRQQEFPLKSRKSARKLEQLTVLLLEQDHCIAIHKRPSRGLLAGLWELPHLPGHPGKKELQQILRSLRLTPVSIRRLPDAVHIFSHIEWQMKGWHIKLKSSGNIAEAPVGFDAPLSGLIWASREMIEKSYSIPAAFQHFL